MSRDRILMNLRAYLRGIANVDPKHLVTLSECTTVRSLARADLERRVADTLGELSDEEVRAIASGHLDLQLLAREAMVGRSLAGTESVLQPFLSAAARSELEDIAKAILDIAPLEAQGSERHDLHTVGVWAVKCALEQAYIAGGIGHPRPPE